MSEPQRGQLKLWSGVGLVAANMIGAGVLISTGFMAQSMGPGPILLAWGVGAVLALSGARAYAAVALIVPRSGGEYRYLSELLHPALGYVAGWASLLIGFSAPIAVDALAAGAFAHTLSASLDPRWVGAGLIGALTLLHIAGLKSSVRGQNALVAVKAVLVVGFVGLGLFAGTNHWPQWTPPLTTPGFPLEAFVGSLFYIAFAFSGWNAASYAAEEFHEPRRDVPRAMLIGCALVAALYFAVNWIFVANLDASAASAVFRYDSEQVTLGHVIVQRLVGPGAGRAMSAVVILLFVSAMSAMTFAGPRVYAAMAKDGFLPRVFAGREGRPPVASVLLQSALALVIVFTHELYEVLKNLGAILTLFAALTVIGLFRARFAAKGRFPKPPVTSLVAAAIYAASAGYMLYFGFKDKDSKLLWWVGVVLLAAFGAYGLTRWLVPRALNLSRRR
ncbi:MAG: APC family permease [Myxococcaceae bacterium]